VVQPLLQPVLDLGKTAAAQSETRAPAGADDARHDRHVVADDIVKEERRVRLVDESRDVTDIDRLPDVSEFLLCAQPLQEPPEILAFVHASFLDRFPVSR
jgi:hypothetical protein